MKISLEKIFVNYPIIFVFRAPASENVSHAAVKTYGSDLENNDERKIAR